MHDSTWPHRTSWREKTNQLIAMRKQIGCSSGILILHTIAIHRRMIMKNCLREKGKFELDIQFSLVQSLSCARLFVTPWITACQASLSITISGSSLKLTSIDGDAIQLSHPLSSPSPPTPNPSQHQGLLQWVNSSHEVAKVLEFQLQYQSLQWTPRTDLP